MLISVDFWKSMHGFAMDSRTRAVSPVIALSVTVNLIRTGLAILISI